MMVTKLLLVCCLAATASLNLNGAERSKDLQKDISMQMESPNGNYLSRKRRYLMFPAGSSFQLVFCLTYSSVAVGSYFVFGHTAALAFELPSMPLFFDQRDFQKKEEEPAETTTAEIPHDIDLSTLDHSDHERIGSDFSSWDLPYDKIQKKFDSGFTGLNFNNKFTSPHYNPFFGFARNPGYSTIERSSFVHDERDNNFRKIVIRKPNVNSHSKYDDFQRYNRNSHMTLNMDPKYYPIHRRTRRNVYKQIENFLTTLNLDGKSCLLKAICEMSKSTVEKGTFMEEVFKAVFRPKPHDDYRDEDDYDAATNQKHNCTEMYSSCQGSIRNYQLLIRK